MADFLKVMIIENEEDYADSLRDNAAYKGIELVHFENLEDGLTELSDNYSSYDGLILDGKGHLSADKPVEKDVHAYKALKKLAEFEEEGKVIPRVINTGYFEDMKDIAEYEDINVFEKSKEEDEMLAVLKEMIEKSEIYQYRRQYPDIFSLFSKKFFPQRKELELVQILSGLESKKASEIKSNLALIRTFLEPFYKALNMISSDYLPNAFIDGDRVNLYWSEIYVSGRTVEGDGDDYWEPEGEIVDNHIARQLELIRTVTSKAGNHDYAKKFTNMTLKSATFALLDVLNWYHSWLQSLKN